MTTIDELRVIADEVRELRPDWGLQGLLGELAKVRDRGSPDEVRTAALKAAADPGARSPAAVGFDSNWAQRPERNRGPARYTRLTIPDPIAQAEAYRLGPPLARDLITAYRGALEAYHRTGDLEAVRIDLLAVLCHCDAEDHRGRRHAPLHGPAELRGHDRWLRPWPKLPTCQAEDCHCPAYGT